jgi:hypothetical protein
MKWFAVPVLSPDSGRIPGSEYFGSESGFWIRDSAATLLAAVHRSVPDPPVSDRSLASAQVSRLSDA